MLLHLYLSGSQRPTNKQAKENTNASIFDLIFVQCASEICLCFSIKLPIRLNIPNKTDKEIH